MFNDILEKVENLMPLVHYIMNDVMLNAKANIVLSGENRSLWWMISGKLRRLRLCQKIKDYVIGALQDGLNLGHERGPRLNVGYKKIK